MQHIQEAKPQVCRLVWVCTAPRPLGYHLPPEMTINHRSMRQNFLYDLDIAYEEHFYLHSFQRYVKHRAEMIKCQIECCKQVMSAGPILKARLLGTEERREFSSDWGE